MTIKDIKTGWLSLNEQVNPLTAKNIDVLGLKAQTVDFLKGCGFPRQSAPFLSFVDNSNREADTISNLSNLYDLPIEYNSYVSIGSDGAGNPIVINTKQNDTIELLDHEQDFECIGIINTDVFSLSACLIAYNTFIKTVIETNGAEAYLDANFTNEQFDILKNTLLSIDKKSTETGFWGIELNTLLVNREFYQKKE